MEGLIFGILRFLFVTAKIINWFIIEGSTSSMHTPFHDMLMTIDERIP